MNDFMREVKDAYDSSADAWAEGPARVYGHLATALLKIAPSSLSGCLVLDLGSGTGVVSSVLIDAAAHPIGLDLALAMLRHDAAHRPPAVVGDAMTLPFVTGAFDAVVAGFCINHLPDPAVGLAECRRVLRPGGVLLASTFPSDAEHPAKVAVEAALARFGYQRPSWYDEFKSSTAAGIGAEHRLADVATTAGLTDVDVTRLTVSAGLNAPDLAVAWRFNMPHTIGFVSSLPLDEQEQLVAEAIANLPTPLPAEVTMLALTARAPVVS